MNQKKIMISLLLACSLTITGCGSIQSSKDTKHSKQTSSSAEANSDQNNTNSTSKNSKETATPVVTPEPQEGTFSSSQAYSDADRELTVLGFKQYKKLKTAKFTDKASSGKVYLVLFLKVRNNRSEDEYFNPNYLTAKVDGKDITNTYLLNAPEGYPTIFDTVKAQSSFGGFIVWEVPKNWKEFSVIYDGWKDIAGLSLKCDLTKKDFFKPEQYSENDFY